MRSTEISQLDVFPFLLTFHVHTFSNFFFIFFLLLWVSPGVSDTKIRVLGLRGGSLLFFFTVKLARTVDVLRYPGVSKAEAPYMLLSTHRMGGRRWKVKGGRRTTAVLSNTLFFTVLFG